MPRTDRPPLTDEDETNLPRLVDDRGGNTVMLVQGVYISERAWSGVQEIIRLVAEWSQDGTLSPTQTEQIATAFMKTKP